MQVRGLNITLGKQKSLFWIQLSRQKYGWIKKDTVGALDSDSDSDPGSQDSLRLASSSPTRVRWTQLGAMGRHTITSHVQ